MYGKKNLISVAATVAAVAGYLTIGAGAAHAQRSYAPTGPDSFLNYQVNSTEELVQELQGNRKLRLRYAKHFGLPETEVVDWVKRALVPYRLPADRDITVYGVTKNGRIYPVKTRLKKGTRVWATRSGVPVLKWACANPLTNEMPGTRLPAPARPTASRGTAPGGRINTMALSPVAVITPVAPAPTPAIAAPGAIAAPVVPPLTGTGVAAALAYPGASIPVPGGRGGGGGGGAALIPVAFALLPHGGGGGSNSGSGTTTIDLPGITMPPGSGVGTSTAPGSGGSGGGNGSGTGGSSSGGGGGVAVPEPGTIALIGLAAPLMLGAAAIRRRRNSR